MVCPDRGSAVLPLTAALLVLRGMGLLWGYRMPHTKFSQALGKHGDEKTIGNYVKNQGQEYQQLHADYQPGLF